MIGVSDDLGLGRWGLGRSVFGTFGVSDVQGFGRSEFRTFGVSDVRGFGHLWFRFVFRNSVILFFGHSGLNTKRQHQPKSTFTPDLIFVTNIKNYTCREKIALWRIFSFLCMTIGGK